MVCSKEMQARTTLTLGNFFLTIVTTLVNYVFISYLSSFFSETYIGLAIAGGSLVAIAAFVFLPGIVARYGAQKVLLYLVFAEMFALMTVSGLPHTAVSAALILIVMSMQPLLYYELDLLLEATINGNDATARARTFFLTGGNAGAIVAPLMIATLLAGGEAYTTVFFAAAIVAVLFVVFFSARQLPKNAPPTLYHVRDTLVHIFRHRDLAAVTTGHFILYLFYLWAPFYVPAYLHGVLGIPWATLGWVFSIMLIPYVLIEYPAGWLADRVLGDKWLMLAGFLIAGTALALISTITASTPIVLIVVILVMTRVGAALTESMTEGHFYRRVSQQDIVSISVFRGVWPLANIVAPLVGALIFSFDGFHYFFLITGCCVALIGGMTALSITDFRREERTLPLSSQQAVQ